MIIITKIDVSQKHSKAKQNKQRGCHVIVQIKRDAIFILDDVYETTDTAPEIVQRDGLYTYTQQLLCI